MIDTFWRLVMLQVWVTFIKANERDLGQRVRGGLRRRKGLWELRMQTDLPVDDGGWQVRIYGSLKYVADTLRTLDGQNQRPSMSWYPAQTHTP